MTIQEENNQKLIRFNVEASKFSLKVLVKFFKFTLKNIGSILENNKTNYKLKDLVKKEKNLTKIDLNNLKDDDLKDFHLIAKKCGLKYSLVKDPEKNMYTFFFNIKSPEIYSYVVKELEKKLNEKLNLPNIKEQLEKTNNISKDIKLDVPKIEPVLENKAPKLSR